MFADSFCDSGWSNRSHRGWTTLISFAAQAVAVGCLLLVPLLYTQGLPRLAVLSPLLAPAPLPAAQVVQQRTVSVVTPQSNEIGIRLLRPSQIPRSVDMLNETTAPPPMSDASAFGIDHATGDPNGRGSVLDAIQGSGQVLPPPPLAVTRHPPVSRMMEGNIILRIQPNYPSIAKQARIQGEVLLRAMISRDGTIENLQVLSGHPMLAHAAVEAVRQWRYRPYVLNGEPVEVETEVTVKFVLSGG
jgi:periplasmic protein TonB